jgi:hypothetical protein
MAAHTQPHDFAVSALHLNLYPWQANALATAGRGMPSVVCAPNGSGKSSVTITGLILWFLHEFPLGRAVVTSGSWAQLVPMHAIHGSFLKIITTEMYG